LAKEAARGEKAASKEREQQERLRNRPQSANFMVAGAQHEDPSLPVAEMAKAIGVPELEASLDRARGVYRDAGVIGYR
jgi:hypothetical protein